MRAGRWLQIGRDEESKPLKTNATGCLAYHTMNTKWTNMYVNSSIPSLDVRNFYYFCQPSSIASYHGSLQWFSCEIGAGGEGGTGPVGNLQKKTLRRQLKNVFWGPDDDDVRYDFRGIKLVDCLRKKDLFCGSCLPTKIELHWTIWFSSKTRMRFRLMLSSMSADAITKWFFLYLRNY